MQGQTVLVTGGAGFVGSHFVDAFVAAGCSVAVVDNLRTGCRENVNPAARFYEIDLRDKAALADVIARERPAVISHQAAAADVRQSLVNPQEYAEINILGTLNLVQAASGAGTRKIVFASTGGAVYGDPRDLPATEATPAAPLDPYGVSKLACEYYLESFRRNFGLDCCILRYANVYGPRQNARGEAGVVAVFANQMLAGRAPVIFGDGQNQRDFVYGPDVARANVLAAAVGSGIYNIGTGIPTDINALYDRLAAITGHTEPPRRGPAKPGEVRASWLDASRAARELGWVAAVALEDGLRATVDWQRASAPKPT